MPDHLHRGSIGGDSHGAVERAAGAIVDAGLIIGGADLMLHDGKRTLEADLPQGGRRLFAVAGEIAGNAVGHVAGAHLHDGLFDAVSAAAKFGIRQQGCNRERAGKSGDAGESELEFECGQHGNAFEDGRGRRRAAPSSRG